MVFSPSMFLPNFSPPKKKTRSFFSSLGFPYTIAHRKDGTFTPPFPCLGHHLGRPNRKAPFRGFFGSPPKETALTMTKHAKTHLMFGWSSEFLNLFLENLLVFLFVKNSYLIFLVGICFRVCLMMVSDLSSFHVVFISWDHHLAGV